MSSNELTDPMAQHLLRLRLEMVRMRAGGRVMPLAIAVPAGFVPLCRREYLGLPIVPAEVLEPTLQLPGPSMPEANQAQPPAPSERPLAFRRVDVTFVVGSHFYHADSNCAVGRIVPSVGRKHLVVTVDCEAAHRSRLLPCQECSVVLERRLNHVFGPIPLESKRSRPLPTFDAPGHTDRTQGSHGLAYGTPDDPEDSRFQHRSALDWGTLSYASDPDEFYGEPTDDDHDWRGQ